MLTTIFLLVTLAQLLFLGMSVQRLRRNRSLYTAVATAVILGLVYDNIIIAIGRFIGEGALLSQLSIVRFVIHGLLTPLMIMFAWRMGQGFGLSWGEKPAVYWGFAGLTAVMVALGSYTEIITLTLKPIWDGDILRYTHADPSGPPIPSIVVIVVAIVVGAFLWRQKKWWVMCVGAILMFIFAGAGASILLLSNIGEVIYVGSIVWTDYELEQRQTKNANGIQPY